MSDTGAVPATDVTTPPGGAARRVAWGLFDQVLSSASNFLVTIIAAASLSATDFGGFALATAVCIITVSVSRGLASDPLATAHAGDGEDELRWAIKSAASVSVAVSLVVAVVIAGIGFVVGGTIAWLFLALALTLPGVTLQDYLRYALIVRGDAKKTFVNDLFWTILQIGFLVVAIALDGGSVALFLAWGVAGNLAAALGLVQARTWIGGPGTIRPWLRRHRTLWPFFVLDNVVYQATTLVLVIVIALASSLAQVGGFRAAVTLFAPLAIIGRGVVGVAVPELARHRDDPVAVRRISLRIAWALTPMAMVWAILMLLIPDSLGRKILGGSWDLAEPLLVLAGAATCVSLFTVGTVVGIRALGAGREGLTARLVVSAVVLVSASIGAVVDGAHGALALLAWTAPIQIATWWWLLVKASQRALRTQSEARVEESA